MFKRWASVIVGVLLIVAAGVWKFGVSQQFTNRVTTGWQWETRYIGTTLYADENGNYEGNFPADDPVNIYTRSIYISTDQSSAPDGSIVIEDESASTDIITGEVTWEQIFKAPVDPATGQITSGKYKGMYLLFPRNVEKKTYMMAHNTYAEVPFEFQGEENVGGINAYHFTARLKNYEDTQTYASTADFEGIDLPAGQGIHCADLATDYWVEPVTGELVRIHEQCTSDDIFDTNTGNFIAHLCRWTGETAGDDVIRQVTTVQNRQAIYLWASLYGPLAALALGVILAGVGLVQQRAGTAPKAA